jgi:hypothetical protein
MVYFKFIHVLHPYEIWLMNRIISRFPGKQRVAVSLNSTIRDFIQSSSIAISEKLVREAISIICDCVPWFCRVIHLNGENGCMSSPSTKQGEQMKVVRGKENNRAKGVEGLLIFAKRDRGTFIGREEVLKEFRLRKREWEKTRDGQRNQGEE